MERLQKVMAHHGIASRRKCEEMITEGRVTVNGNIVTELGFKVDQDKDKIEVDGKILGRPERKVYFILNKPEGFVTTVDDPEGRRTVMDFFHRIKERIYPVGRLDYDTEGLLLMTNDGEMAYALTHPSHQIQKSYLLEVKGRVSTNNVAKLRKGVRLDDGWTAPAKVNIVHADDHSSILEMKIHEGRNRQIRRMMLSVGHPVRKLKRYKFGPLDLEGLGVGQFRPLTGSELNRLHEIASKVKR